MTVLQPVEQNAVSPGLLGFLVVAALGLALFFLIKSMNRQIKKIEVPHENEPGKDRPGDENPPNPPAK
ncbi:hypothetical protein [Bailinhaonella thermotolerans]|uniref:hypothetical protein n=1 Tax=Bailinhaonella thermotolerans TaxID=1070861 RepID=UPI00192A6902|nr:hypothetical protein [Bailinhaonella thermotolerans]